MSSILEALKKAEKASVADDGNGTPWPAPTADSPAHRPQRRGLWIPLGGVAVLCVLGAAFWLTRGTDPDPPPVTAKRAVEPVQTENAQTAAPADKAAPPTTSRKSAAIVPSSPSTSPSKKQPLPAVRPDPHLKKPLLPLQRQPMKSVEAEFLTQAQPEAAQNQLPVEMADAPPPSGDTRQESQKEFRSDERIDLQALVWSPEAADRFVVINNRLLREGGSIDEITVVRINSDDVLLSERSDRWYQEFKIR